LFPEHLPLSVIQTGVKTKKFLQVRVFIVLYPEVFFFGGDAVFGYQIRENFAKIVPQQNDHPTLNNCLDIFYFV